MAWNAAKAFWRGEPAPFYYLALSLVGIIGVIVSNGDTYGWYAVWGTCLVLYRVDAWEKQRRADEAAKCQACR